MLEGEEAYELLVVGKNHEGYWTGEHVVKQLERVVAMAKLMHPNCELVFIFDNSSNHSFFSNDSLIASRLTLRPHKPDTSSEQVSQVAPGVEAPLGTPASGALAPQTQDHPVPKPVGRKKRAVALAAPAETDIPLPLPTVSVVALHQPQDEVPATDVPQPASGANHSTHGWFFDKTGLRRDHRLVFFSGDENLPSQDYVGGSKGIKIILSERGRWPVVKPIDECRDCKLDPRSNLDTRGDCCATRVMHLQPDFIERRVCLQVFLGGADGWYFNQLGEKVHQPFANDDGTRKSLAMILEERGLISTCNFNLTCSDCGLKEALDPGREVRVNCCARRKISNEPDFLAQKCALEEYLISQGCRCLFLAKYHPECNPIERYWGYCKRTARLKCSFDFKGLQKHVPEALKSCPVATIRRFFRKAWRFYDAYSKNLSGPFAAFVVKKYRSHRRIPEAIEESLAAWEKEFKSLPSPNTFEC